MTWYARRMLNRTRESLAVLCWVLALAVLGAAPPAYAQPNASAEAEGKMPPAGSASALPPSPEVDANTADAPVDAAESSAPPSRRPARSNPASYGLNLGLGKAPPTVLRDTPRSTVQGFLQATRRGEYDIAAYYVHLWGIPSGRQKTEGPKLAKQLAHALERAVWFDLDQVPDTSTGAEDEDAKPREDVKIATVDLEHGSHGIRLARVRDPFTGEMVWVFSASTVQLIDQLDEAFGPPAYVQGLPSWMREHKVLGLVGFQWAGLIVLALLSWLGGALLERPALWIIQRAVRRNGEGRGQRASALTRGLVHWLFALLIVLGSLPLLRLTATASIFMERTLLMGIILVVMVGGLRFVRISVEAFRERHVVGVDDPLRVRSMETRLNAVHRVTQVLVVIVGVALALMQFPTARTVGISLLGSAGIAGAILGFAAQKTFSNLFAGILISFSQPIRIGDTVIVENEYGTIEAIGSTHVVVCIWDLRRLVVPVTYFLDKPFQNWTKLSAKMWGTVILHVDYRVDVEEVRAELDRILEDEPMFNGEAKRVLVLDMTEQSAVLRITVSADDASTLWDLRCKVREDLLKWLQKEPWRLPRHRLEGTSLVK